MKKYLAPLLFLTAVLSAPLGAHAGFSYLGSGAGGFTNLGSNSHSASITIPAGTDLLIILAFHEGLNTNNPTAPSAATVAGSSATAVAQTPTGDQNTGWVKMFFYLAPPTGVQTVAVTGATGAGGGNGTGYQWAAYSGFAQSGQPDSSGKADVNTSRATMPMSASVIKSNCVLVAGFAHQNLTGVTYTGLTKRLDTTPENAYGIADSNGIVGTGSQTGTVNFSPNQGGSGIITAFCLKSTTFNPALFFAF